MTGRIEWRRLFWGAGRVTRTQYWILLIGVMATGYLSHPIFVALARAVPSSMGYAAVGMLAVDACVAWMTICVCAQRLHDLGRTGWWQLVPLGLVTAAYALAEPAWNAALGLGDTWATVALTVGAVGYLAALAILGSIRGELGPNRFGAPDAEPA
jgi:uncharacterized membrane protein YhaH (DUF805 family)